MRISGTLISSIASAEHEELLRREDGGGGEIEENYALRDSAVVR